MAKKRVRKKSARRVSKVSKKTARKVARKKTASRNRTRTASPNKAKRKIDIAVRNLFFFVILFVFSLILYYASKTGPYVNLFFILSMLFGFIALAFLIVYLVLFFMKVFRK
jgi:lipopolysaccharide/colanic/teichoic acid biosynthesis glycosyltransferase